MRLQLRASHAERRFEFHVPNGWIRPENHLDVGIKIDREIDLAGVAMRLTAHFAEIGVSLCNAAARWTKQVPRHVENAGARRTQEHLEHSASIHFPMIGERVWPNPLEGQFIRMIEKLFETRHQTGIRALPDHRLTQGLEA